jgi:hypothetical protein
MENEHILYVLIALVLINILINISMKYENYRFIRVPDPTFSPMSSPTLSPSPTPSKPTPMPGSPKWWQFWRLLNKK